MKIALREQHRGVFIWELNTGEGKDAYIVIDSKKSKFFPFQRKGGRTQRGRVDRRIQFTCLSRPSLTRPFLTSLHTFRLKRSRIHDQLQDRAELQFKIVVIHLHCDNSHSLPSYRQVMGKTFFPGNEQKIHRQTDTRRHRGEGWEKICASSSRTQNLAKRGEKSENVT